MPHKECAFFLGANSRHGFVSLFDDFAAEDFERDVYMIKSGPGCGKSTMIRRVCQPLAGEGELVEAIYCSSDPGSLDGMALCTRGLAVLDATAPHVLEPAFPGARGGYLALPEFLDREKLKEKYPALLTLSAAAKEHYAQAYRLISAAAQVDDHITQSIRPYFAADRLRRRAKGIIAREMPRKGPRRGAVKKRFIDGITPNGVMRFTETIDILCSRVYDLFDSYGFAPILLQPLLEGAVAQGYDVYACYCPKDPSRLLHLLIPELSLGFTISSPARCYAGSPYRRIRVDACIDYGPRKQLRGHAKILTRLSEALTADAVQEIAAAHALHDRIEEIYRPHIDLPALDRRAEEIRVQLQK